MPTSLSQAWLSARSPINCVLWNCLAAPDWNPEHSATQLFLFLVIFSGVLWIYSVASASGVHQRESATQTHTPTLPYSLFPWREPQVVEDYFLAYLIHSSAHTSTPISQFIPPRLSLLATISLFSTSETISVSAPGRFILPVRTQQQSKVPGTFWDLLSLNFKAEVMVSVLEMKQARFRGKLRGWCPRPHTRQSGDPRPSPAFLLDSHASRVPSSELLRGCTRDHAPAGAQTQ